jgi:hypothetical protein
MKYQYRITKYNPANRDESGAYQLDEWTAFSDIGKEFSGVRLRKTEYLEVESAYLTAVKSFLEEARLPALFLKGLEIGRAKEIPAFVKEGASLSVPQCVEFSRSVLREELWGRLVIPGRAYVHFGWDYYMYIGVPVPCHSSIEAAGRGGLFVEPFRSPYLRARSNNLLQRTALSGRR